MVTGEARQALAVVVVELVDADTCVAAWVAGALVDVDRAFRPCPARLAHAVVAQRLFSQISQILRGRTVTRSRINNTCIHSYRDESDFFSFLMKDDCSYMIEYML